MWGPLVGGLPSNPDQIVFGIVFGLGFYLVARKLASAAYAARAAYFLIGGLAILAGFVGHKHNFFVGTSLLVLSVALPFGSTWKSKRVPLAGN